MTEKLAITAVAAASGAASYGWLGAANDVATLVVTIIAGLGGVAALLYHFERYRKLRSERKDNGSKE